MEFDTGIDIKELKCFVTVVENKSFSRAAKQLNLTQPTVSAHISALEQKLGVRLIVLKILEVCRMECVNMIYSIYKWREYTRPFTAYEVSMSRNLLSHSV